MVYHFNQIQLKREFKSLSDISLKEELNKQYQYYPNAAIHAFLRGGISNFEEMKTMLKSDQIHRFRNLGPKRIEMAQKIIEKYERESILFICDYCECYTSTLNSVRLNSFKDSLINLCHDCYKIWDKF
ncbi:MAG: hypothetical protein JEZ08_20345 [Clostridiales bacterium]|nr:hypothetical protein [Clostridiales bacterium]